MGIGIGSGICTNTAIDVIAAIIEQWLCTGIVLGCPNLLFHLILGIFFLLCKRGI